MIRKLTMGSALTLAMALGCAHEPTDELTAARNAYEQAAQGQAARLAPNKVWEAKQALTKAEFAYEEEPGSDMEKDLAYIALRKANYANALANLKTAESEQRKAKENYAQVLEMQRDHTKVALDQRDRELDDTQDTLQSQEQDLMEARRAQEQLERQLGVALGSLQEMAKVDRDQQNRTVLTLDGEVLFPFGKAELLPTAERRLEKVAKVLSKYNQTGKQIIVEGHTDAIGSDSFNRDLSEKRAEAVADFLVRNGVDRQVIATVGRGESEPLATNDTPTGRANNRRVELIIEDPTMEQGGPVYQGQGPQQGQQQQGQQQQGQQQQGQQEQGQQEFGPQEPNPQDMERP